MAGFICPKLVLSLFILLSLSIIAQAQRPTVQPPAKEAEEARMRERRERQRLERELKDIAKPARSPARNSTFYSKKMTDAQKKMLAPSQEDQAAFAEFLKQSNTGLVKLLPSGQHELGYTVSVKEDPDAVLPIRGGGAYYSFSEKTHSFGPWSEICSKEGHFITGFASETLGLVTSLGDVPLESVTLSSEGVNYLSNYVPPKSYKEAQMERNRQFVGFNINNFTYRAIIPIALNTTYVVRSISYEKRGRLIGGALSLYVPHPYEYEGADVLLAFRVVRQAEDGSATLLWKRLKKFPTPKVKRKD